MPAEFYRHDSGSIYVRMTYHHGEHGLDRPKADADEARWPMEWDAFKIRDSKPPVADPLAAAHARIAALEAMMPKPDADGIVNPDVSLASFDHLADELRRRGAAVMPAPHGGDAEEAPKKKRPAKKTADPAAS